MAKWSINVIFFYAAIVWWWCFFSNIPSATCFLNKTDRHALMAFKDAIQHDPFGALSSWNDTLQFCDWNGVLCSRRHHQRVITLKLMSQGLVGSFSPFIANLSFLKVIVLKNNSFHGPIPQEIGHLFRLRTIEFSNNSFSGEIPNNLSHCSNLRYLNLIDNSLVGNIPPELGSLSKLEALGLGTNKLSGTIPPSIGNISSLFGISLMNCGLQGKIPEEITLLQHLRILQLSENKLSGKIPTGLFNISTITFLVVADNQLQGSIPSDIGLTLPNLQYLIFGINRFTGMIPISLSNASALEIISFDGNDFTGLMPKDLGRLLGLSGMYFSHNRLKDDFSFISSLTNCTSLRTLVVNNNLLKGSLSDSVANLSTHMSTIYMHRNQLHGRIPSGIENLLSLTSLSMSVNYLTGPIPMGIGKLHKLQELYLGMNEFTEELPSSLGNLTLLNRLYLGQTNIYGSIPSSFGNCSNLLELDLSHNNLNGSIPREIMSLSSISISFSLADNALTGTIPLEVGSFRNLVELDLSNNRLFGSLPSSLSNCLSLQRLYLEGNSFDGEIPQSLSVLKGLQELDLSHNNFSGQIPSYLGVLILEKLNLSFNKLQGEVPIKGVFRNASAISVIGNNELCGGIADLKLALCPSPYSQSGKLSHAAKVIIPVVAAVVVCLVFLVSFFIFLHRKKMSRTTGSNSSPSFKNQFLRVSYAELLKATDGLSQASLIGVGSYGSVYKGILQQGQIVVAVKVLNLHLRGASKSFMSECKALRTLRHRNLLKILSVCSSVDFQGNDFKALVYEFMANGSLEKWLHPDRVGKDEQQEESRNLELIQRLNVAIDIASALQYLHYGSESTIVHGDLKPSNVLLDDEMTAHVGDFGLAKVISTISSDFAPHQSNSVAIKGTIGYVPPEYGMGDKVSPQGDVYSFGILLLEMFTGKKPTDDAFQDDLSLHNLITSAFPDQVTKIVDPHILSEHDTGSRIKDCLVSILEIGVACSMESPRDRMETRHAVIKLRKTKDIYTKEGLNRQ